MKTRLIPIAISSQFDKSGDERVHAAGYDPFVPFARDVYNKFLTSKPFPQMNLDTSSYEPSLIGGELRGILHVTEYEDNSSYSPSLMGGYLGPKIYAFRVVENVSYEPTLVGGTLKLQLITQSQPSDFAEYTPTLVGGTLKLQLITQSQPSDFAEYTPTLVGGTLE